MGHAKSPRAVVDLTSQNHSKAVYACLLAPLCQTSQELERPVAEIEVHDSFP